MCLRRSLLFYFYFLQRLSFVVDNYRVNINWISIDCRLIERLFCKILKMRNFNEREKKNETKILLFVVVVFAFGIFFLIHEIRFTRLFGIFLLKILHPLKYINTREYN
mgnify:CR=1 FL=1